MSAQRQRKGQLLGQAFHWRAPTPQWGDLTGDCTLPS
eukprot:CAMPEP_0183444070 /NCGR_PEP_ID=MMETSP0370-20130417/93930_1 /TAXON_ID=268820 /ORGANISM="Peridinium aciculiferum, Strain PAER-2" /LENGTH=36 /DNA_ID= /DNA_START= /DNA_END= /DNA_ORIENTATION=